MVKHYIFRQPNGAGLLHKRWWGFEKEHWRCWYGIAKLIREQLIFNTNNIIWFEPLSRAQQSYDQQQQFCLQKKQRDEPCYLGNRNKQQLTKPWKIPEHHFYNVHIHSLTVVDGSILFLVRIYSTSVIVTFVISQMEKQDDKPAGGPKAKKQKIEIAMDDSDKNVSPAARIQDAILAACQAKPQVNID